MIMECQTIITRWSSRHKSFLMWTYIEDNLGLSQVYWSSKTYWRENCRFWMSWLAVGASAQRMGFQSLKISTSCSSSVILMSLGVMGDWGLRMGMGDRGWVCVRFVWQHPTEWHVRHYQRDTSHVLTHLIHHWVPTRSKIVMMSWFVVVD